MSPCFTVERRWVTEVSGAGCPPSPVGSMSFVGAQVWATVACVLQEETWELQQDHPACAARHVHSRSGDWQPCRNVLASLANTDMQSRLIVRCHYAPYNGPNWRDRQWSLPAWMADVQTGLTLATRLTFCTAKPTHLLVPAVRGRYSGELRATPARDSWEWP